MFRGLLLGTLVVALVASFAVASPIVNITLTPVAAFTDASLGTQVAANTADTQTLMGMAPGQVGVAASGSNYVYELALKVAVPSSSLAAGEYLDTVINGYTFTGTGLTFPDVNGDATNLLTDAYQTGSPGIVVAQNGVVGSNATEAIQVAVTAAIGHSKVTNISNGITIGNIFVQWDGTNSTVMSVQAATNNSGGNLASMLTWEGDTAGNSTTFSSWQTNGYTTNPGTATFTSAPEPATMSLLVLGGIGALLRRRK